MTRRVSPAEALTPEWVVYQFYDERGQLLYVGMTGELRHRLRAHSKQDYWRLVKSIEVEDFSDRDGAAMREGDLIYELDPPLNTAGRRTKDVDRGDHVHGPIVSCGKCTAMGLIRFGKVLVDAGWVDPHKGDGFGYAAHFHRCRAA